MEKIGKIIQMKKALEKCDDFLSYIANDHYIETFYKDQVDELLNKIRETLNE